MVEAPLQAVQLNRKIKVRYPETSLRLREGRGRGGACFKVPAALNNTHLLIVLECFDVVMSQITHLCARCMCVPVGVLS